MKLDLSQKYGFQKKCETIFGKTEVIEMQHIETDSPSKYLASFMTQIEI